MIDISKDVFIDIVTFTQLIIEVAILMGCHGMFGVVNHPKYYGDICPPPFFSIWQSYIKPIPFNLLISNKNAGIVSLEQVWGFFCNM